MSPQVVARIAAILGACLLSGCYQDLATSAGADASEHDGPRLPEVDARQPVLPLLFADVGAVVLDDALDTDSANLTPDVGVPDVPTPADADPTDAGAPVDVDDRDASLPVDTGAPTDTGPRRSPSPADRPVPVDVPAPVDRPVPVDAPAPVDVGTLPSSSPAVPGWDSATVAHVRELRARGVAMGNRLGVFAKIGDSITESGSFLFDIGFGWSELGGYAALNTTIQYFRATTLDGGVSSFNRSSACATAGWTTDDALAGGNDAPIWRELRAIRPSWAIVMYGTNDVDRSTVAAFTTNLNRIVDIIESAGTVPALSTIPDRNDGADRAARALQISAAIRSVAAARHLPLLDYWAALQGLPMHGVSEDGIHPSVYLSGGSTASASFTPAGLQYGYNMRNLTALLMLDRMRSLP
ncbi:MAG: SGNH/GDSL hydrolase family protein [Deltaproteobacteria bacterium]|nr:SGNH/GDSL hydrolase family protein [Deltaproteobacteria bacterium]